jgi:hypothetical protein
MTRVGLASRGEEDIKCGSYLLGSWSTTFFCLSFSLTSVNYNEGINQANQSSFSTIRLWLLILQVLFSTIMNTPFSFFLPGAK